jgi:nicotinamide-nucleotide amidase
VLDVPSGPVVTEECAVTMAVSVARLLGSDVAVAVTGVGGPESQEGHPPGTVWFGVAARGDVTSELRHFKGEPDDVVGDSTTHALRLLEGAVRRLVAAA